MVIASSLLVVFQLLGILVVTKYLSKLVCPVNMLRMSQKCLCIAPVWKEDEDETLEPIQKFLENPTKIMLDKTNNTLQQLSKPDLITLSINNGYFELLKVIIFDLGEPIKKKFILKAFQRKNDKIFKILLKTAKKRTDSKVKH